MRSALMPHGAIHDSTCSRNCPHWNGQWQSGGPDFPRDTPRRRIHGLSRTQPLSRRVVAAAIERNRS